MDSVTKSARDQHRAAVLALLHSGVHLTRSQIAGSLGITRSTISEVLAELQTEGAVVVSQIHRGGGRGRPAEVLCSHPGAVRYIGVDFTHTRVRASLANSTGEVIARDSTTYARGDGWEKRCQVGIELVRALATEDIHFGSLSSIAIGLPGPNSATWDSGLPTAVRDEPFHMVSARIRELFSNDFGVPVLVDHHVRLAALSEAAVGRTEGVQNLIYLRLSTGIGGAVLTSGAIATGANQLAGEMGHFTVVRGPEALLCRCDRYGCLETVASLEALTKAWAAQTGSSGDRDDFESAALQGDRVAVELLRNAAEQVGTVLALAVLVTDPGEIVLAGEVPHLLPDFLDRVQAAMWPGVLPAQKIPVRHTQLGEEAGARGGIVALMSAQPDAQQRPEHPAGLVRIELPGGTRVS